METISNYGKRYAVLFPNFSFHYLTPSPVTPIHVAFSWILVKLPPEHRKLVVKNHFFMETHRLNTPYLTLSPATVVILLESLLDSTDTLERKFW